MAWGQNHARLRVHDSEPLGTDCLLPRAPMGHLVRRWYRVLGYRAFSHLALPYLSALTSPKFSFAPVSYTHPSLEFLLQV